VAHRSDGGVLHRVERRVENLWAHVDHRQPSGGGELPPLT
jgi:hypothetical protein